MPIFFIDECVSLVTVKSIEECGYQWEKVGISILKGAKDETIFNYVQKKKWY
jgi:hypothetical protein